MSRCLFCKVWVTSFTITTNIVFPRLIMFFKIIHKNLMVLYKVRHVYSAIHEFWSKLYQLVKIFVIINRFFFMPHSLSIQSSNRPGKSFLYFCLVWILSLLLTSSPLRAICFSVSYFQLPLLISKKVLIEQILSQM